MRLLVINWTPEHGLSLERYPDDPDRGKRATGTFAELLARADDWYRSGHLAPFVEEDASSTEATPMSLAAWCRHHARRLRRKADECDDLELTWVELSADEVRALAADFDQCAGALE